ncbi:hypothetical protein BT63DRAFT_459909 [Microthyrium microscopicum]|uniref:Uncharacterized protein n=1 Tax=Microthyrium microscopicum TaxID=703497 RepID=A0A6A6TYL7_9PEZI|nr:hypothetical protein BT63DRAFT_459909 [Microthyrium microscopicum]
MSSLASKSLAFVVAALLSPAFSQPVGPGLGGLGPGLAVPGAQLKTGCGVADFTQDNWNTNDLDDFILGIPQFGQQAGFPRNVLAANSINGDPTFDCTDFSRPGSCSIPGPFPDGSTVCSSFNDLRFGFVAQAYENIYNNLRNMFNGIKDAHDQVNSEGYIGTMLHDISPQPLPVSRDNLLKIQELALNFIPVPEAGAELNFIRKILKKFTKLAKKTVKKAQKDSAMEAETLAEQPEIMQGLLDSVVPTVQSAVMDQLNSIFVNGVTDDSNVQVLLGGAHLNPVMSQSDYASAMAQNIRAYLLSMAMSKIGMTLVVDNIVSTCANNDPEDFLSPDGAVCQRFRLPEDEGTTVTLTSGDHPNAMGDIQNRFGFKLQDIALNAEACKEAGKTFADVDFDAFLDSDTPGVFPDCLFGIHVNAEKITPFGEPLKL